MSTSRSGQHEGRALVAAESEGSSDLQVNVGVFIAHAPGTDRDQLQSFAAQAAEDAVDELASATDVTWRFYLEDPARLPDHDRRRPSEFLDRATHRMVEGPYDLVVVVTDVPLVSNRERFVPGLASPLSRVIVISTRNLRSAPRGEPRRSLDHEAVRWNAATLLVHLVGHVLGAHHRDADGGVMEPFRFVSERRDVPPIDANVKTVLHRIAREIPAAETRPRGSLARLAFHASSAVQNPGRILQALINSRAPLLPLSLPKLSTAAVAPTLVIVFSAESWDVGFHLDNMTAGTVHGYEYPHCRCLPPVRSEPFLSAKTTPDRHRAHGSGQRYGLSCPHFGDAWPVHTCMGDHSRHRDGCLPAESDV